MRCYDFAEFVCPQSHERLALNPSADGVGTQLRSPSGHTYSVVDGVPLLLGDTGPAAAPVQHSRAYYRQVADAYDVGMDWLFQSFHADENQVRGELVELLELQPGQRALEVGCGTGRDVLRIAERVAPSGRLYATGLSEEMLRVGLHRLNAENMLSICPTEVVFFVSDAAQLPFPDDYFDAAFRFGGLNLFADPGRSLSEMSRVVKTGGVVLAGDEGVAPWLRHTEYSAILTNSNPLYLHNPPVELLPPNADHVCLRWLLRNAFYVLSFTVADEPTRLNLDLPIPGQRGGTHRTRFFGKLEGVAPELKGRAEQAARAAGLSVSAWLEEAILRNTEDHD